MKFKISCFVIFLPIFGSPLLQATTDQKIAKLLAADQADRASSNIVPKNIAFADLQRRQAIKKLILKDDIKNSINYLNAGTILHHGSELSEIALARELFVLSAYLRGSYSSLPALAEDRF